MENNWRNKTLEDLEKEKWNDTSFNSHLVRRVSELRKIPLDQFTIEDLRLMINQQIGLKYFVPLAIGILTDDLFAEGDLFEGDLLKSVLNVGAGFWKGNEESWFAMNNLISGKIDELVDKRIDTKTFKAAI